MILLISNFEVMYLALLLTTLLSFFSTNNIDPQTIKPPKTTVYIFLLDECKICREYASELNTLYDNYHSDEIEFVGVFPNFSSKKENIENFKSEFNIKFELKTDYFKKLSHKFDAKILPEVFVYDHNLDKVVYSGRIDDRYVSIGQRRRVIKNFDLESTLSNIVAQKDILITRTQPVGCFINYNDNL